VLQLPQPLHWQPAGNHSYSHSDVGAVAADLTIAIMNLMSVLDPAAVVRVYIAVVVADLAILQHLEAAVVVVAAAGAAVWFLEVAAAWAHVHNDRDPCWDHPNDNAHRRDGHAGVVRRVAEANVLSHIHPLHRAYAQVLLAEAVVPVAEVAHRGVAYVVVMVDPVDVVAAVAVDVDGDSAT